MSQAPQATSVKLTDGGDSGRFFNSNLCLVFLLKSPSFWGENHMFGVFFFWSKTTSAIVSLPVRLDQLEAAIERAKM